MNLQDYELPKPTDERDSSLFAKYCRLTSELIGCPYMQTFKLIEHWQEHTIIRLYNDALRAENPQRAWWGMRKRINGKL